MRLINAKTWELEEFIASEGRPDYAILSHRWVHGEEVTFRDMKGTHRHWMPGWSKIRSCCHQAVQDGLTHAWVDTCCIDKDSSAELSEAINSMYEWYANAKVCYAYLNDVTADDITPFWTKIAESLWFTRSWTLQELLAPADVVFYDKTFSRLGSKHEIASRKQNLKSIPADVLADPQNLLLYPVAVRLSWAASREATRVEDLAYSLFGIFQVNLPLLYGEGERAFIRLQEEIIKHSHDHSILAWTARNVQPVRLGTSDALPLLAPSLSLFENCGDVSTMEQDHEIRPYTMTNIGLEIELQVIPYHLNVYAALLDCGPGSNWSRYAILLARESTRTTRFYRVTVDGQSLVEVSNLANFRWQKMHIVRSPDIEYRRKKRKNEQERTNSFSQFYGIRILAPEFLQHGNAARPYGLVAHHDWEDGRWESHSGRAENPPQAKHSSRIINTLSPLSNTDLAPSGRAATFSSGHARTLSRDLGDSEANQGRNPGWEQNDHIHENSLPTLPPDQGRATMPYTEHSNPQPNQNPGQSARSTQHQMPSYGAKSRTPIGSFEMPLMRTGTAGIIHFDQPVHGIKSIKAGFDFDFCPVVFLATDEADTDLEIQRWIQQQRYVELRKFEQEHFLRDDFHEEGSRHFWTLHPDALRSRSDLNVSREGMIRIHKGVYAFKPKDITKRENWIFKPDESQNWHLAVQLHKVERDQEAYWELNIDWHEEQIAITIQTM